MRIFENEVTAANQFTGLANAGLISLSTLAIPSTGSVDSGNVVGVITYIALELADRTLGFTFDCRLMPVGAALSSTRRITIVADTAAGFALVGCRIPVPAESTGVWQVILTSSGKNVDARLIVVAGTGPWDGGGC